MNLDAGEQLPSPHLPVSRAAESLRSSAIRELLAVTNRRDVISLAGGLPAAEGFPVGRITSTMSELLDQQPEVVLQYSETEGYPPLRQEIARRYHASPEQVVITNGSQQAIELALRATTNPGDVVALADPGYVGAIQAISLSQATMLGVSADRNGMDVYRLELDLRSGRRPTIVYVVPELDNPSGATLSLDRRKRMAELSDTYGFMIIEDDPYSHLRWHGEALPPIATSCDRVISVGTTSKLLSPGLRIGWVVAPPDVSRRIALMKQAVDLHTSTLGQHVVYRLLAHSFLEDHVEHLRALYRGRAAALEAALHRHLGDGISFLSPDGGMFIWARLSAPQIDTARLLPLAIEAGVAFVPGSAFAVSAEQRHPAHLRLSFATVPKNLLDEGARRLADVIATA